MRALIIWASLFAPLLSCRHAATDVDPLPGGPRARGIHPVVEGCERCERGDPDDEECLPSLTDPRKLSEWVDRGNLPALFPAIDSGTIESVYLVPQVLQGLGFLHVRFKRRSDAYTEQRWREFTGTAMALTPEELEHRKWTHTWVDRIARREHCAGSLRSTSRPVMHYVAEPWTEEKWNHGRMWGVTELESGDLVAWLEYW